MIYHIMLFLFLITFIATIIFLIAWIIGKFIHLRRFSWLKGWHILATAIACFALMMIAPSTETKAQRAQDHRDEVAESQADKRASSQSESRKAVSESKAKAKASSTAESKAESRKVASKRSAESKKEASSKKVASSKKAVSESKAKASSKDASKKAAAKSKAASESKKKVAKKKAQTKASSSMYKKVSLEKFTDNPTKYDGTNIQTSGVITFIQRNPDNSTMYYVVIAPKDAYSSSGYADGHGSVTEIDVDTMHAKNLKEGDSITVKGGGLTGTVKLNGKLLKSDIIVDKVSVH